MRKYSFTLEVPDDFNPAELDVNLTYSSDIRIIGENSLILY